MSSLMLIGNPARRKQPYLVNPFRPSNPFRRIHIPKHSFKEWQDDKTGRFAKPPAWALKKPKFKKFKLSRKSKAGRRKLFLKRSHKISPLLPMKIKAMERKLIRLAKPRKVIKIKRSKHMKRRKSHKKSSRKNSWFKQPIRHSRARKLGYRRAARHSNPFSLKGLSRGFVDTSMLIDGGLVVGGMLVTTVAMDFASTKVAFLSTPVGKGLGKLGVAFLIKQGGKMLKISPRYTTMIATGVIASAIKDVADLVLPKLGYAGGIKMLGFGAGYSPDPAQQLGGTGFSPEMGTGGEGDSEYAYSDN